MLNYISEVNAFKHWCRVNHPSTGAIVLWHALHDINNELGWVMRFKAPIETIKPLTGLSTAGIKVARNSLSQSKLIQFENGKGNQAGYYTMVSVCKNVATSEPQSSHSVATSEPQSSHSVAHSLNKDLNKDLNKNENEKDIAVDFISSETTPKKHKFAEYVSMTNDEHQKLVTHYGEKRTKRMIETLDNYKGANGKRYKSDYRAMLTWVVEKTLTEMPMKNQPEKDTSDDFLKQYGFK